MTDGEQTRAMTALPRRPSDNQNLSDGLHALADQMLNQDMRQLLHAAATLAWHYDRSAYASGTTHADGCWMWGPSHYGCAVRKIELLHRDYLLMCDSTKRISSEATPD